MYSRLRLVVATGALIACFALGCGGGSKHSSNVTSASPSPSSTPAPTVEDVPEPTRGEFRNGIRTSMTLSISDNTTTGWVKDGSQSGFAPEGWTRDGSSVGGRLVVRPVPIAMSIKNINNGLPLRGPLWVLSLPESPEAGTVLTHGVDVLVDTGVVGAFYREIGYQWKMSGGQIVVEESGPGDKPEIKRVRLRLRGVRLEAPPTGVADDVGAGNPVVYQGGPGHFTLNGIIVLEQDASYGSVYGYPGSITLPVTP